MQILGDLRLKCEEFSNPCGVLHLSPLSLLSASASEGLEFLAELWEHLLAFNPSSFPPFYSLFILFSMDPNQPEIPPFFSPSNLLGGIWVESFLILDKTPPFGMEIQNFCMGQTFPNSTLPTPKNPSGFFPFALISLVLLPT